MTLKGHDIRFDDPHAQVVDWDDIFASLQRRYRYSAMMDWTVLQHSVLVLRISKVLHPGLTLGHALCAIHDLHEAYIGDMPGPAKQFFPGFVEMEHGFMEAVAAKAGLFVPRQDSEAKALVKRCDTLALLLEAKYFDFHYEDVIRTSESPPHKSRWVYFDIMLDEVAKIHREDPRDQWYEVMQSLVQVERAYPLLSATA